MADLMLKYALSANFNLGTVDRASADKEKGRLREIYNTFATNIEATRMALGAEVALRRQQREELERDKPDRDHSAAYQAETEAANAFQNYAVASEARFKQETRAFYATIWIIDEALRSRNVAHRPPQPVQQPQPQQPQPPQPVQQPPPQPARRPPRPRRPHGQSRRQRIQRQLSLHRVASQATARVNEDRNRVRDTIPVTPRVRAVAREYGIHIPQNQRTIEFRH